MDKYGNMLNDSGRSRGSVELTLIGTKVKWMLNTTGIAAEE